MKKLLLIFLFIINNLYAFGNLVDIPHDGRIILIKKILKILGVNNPNDKVIKRFNTVMLDGFKDNWYAIWKDTSDFQDRKVNKLKNFFVDLVLVNNNRVVNYTFIRIPHEDKVVCICFQSVESEASTILEYYNKINSDLAYKKIKDTENYSVFHKTNYLSDIFFHLKGKVGSVNYLDLISISLK